MRRRILGLAFMTVFSMLPPSSFAGDALPTGLSLIPELTSSGLGEVAGGAAAVTQGNIFRETNSSSLSAITAAVQGGSGMVNINQSSGNLNNQANLRTIAVSPPEGFARTAALPEIVVLKDNVLESAGGRKTDIMQDSLVNYTGIVGVNQSAGSLNTEHNTLSLVIGGAVSLTEAELSGVRSNNNTVVQKGSTQRGDMILDCFRNTQGVVQITQAAGDMNVLGNNIAFSHREISLR